VSYTEDEKTEKKVGRYNPEQKFSLIGHIKWNDMTENSQKRHMESDGAEKAVSRRVDKEEQTENE
jgi:hypothetical protein